MLTALHAHRLTNPPTADDCLSYLLYRPVDSEPDTGQRWPLVLFLHGAGERGDDLERVADHGLTKLIEAGRQFPFVVVAPQCPAYSSWTCELTTLSALLDEAIANNPVDPDRIYLTGLSMGGTGTWAMATRYPSRFAAAVPVCGGWLPESVPRIPRMPVWTFHGEADLVVPISQTEQMVEAMRLAGGDVTFTSYPGVGHDSWVQAYDTPEMYEWLLSHRRQR